MLVIFHFGFVNPEEHKNIQVLTNTTNLALGLNAFQKSRTSLLLVIDFDDFMCMSCLESFLSFCQSFPVHLLEEKAFGILVLAWKDNDFDLKDNAQIAKKKLRGFVRANNIRFPIYLDQKQIFGSLASKGTFVILFDEKNRTIRVYTFPVKKADVDEIHEILIKN